MAIERDVITTWHNTGTAAKASWRRSVTSNVRVDWSHGNAPASVGPAESDTLTCYLWVDVGLVAGDRVAVGISHDDVPPASSLRVTRVQPWTDDGRFEHLEVGAR
jgi:hypothetical protein